jgi:hypothetical protein
MRLCVLLVAVLAAWEGPAVAAPTAVKLTLASTSTKPKVNEPWRWTLTAREAGKPVAAKARLQILLGTTVVGCFKGGTMASCAGPAAGETIAFQGKRTGVIRWPAQAQGVRLTFQAVVTVNGMTRRLRVPVNVQPAAPATSPP